MRRGALNDHARRNPQLPKLQTHPRQRRQPATTASQSARFKRAPQTRPYRSAATFPTLTRPPPGLSAGARAWRPETTLGIISLPSSGNLGSLALFMASTIAHSLTLVKRVSANEQTRQACRAAKSECRCVCCRLGIMSDAGTLQASVALSADLPCLPVSADIRAEMPSWMSCMAISMPFALLSPPMAYPAADVLESSRR